MAAVRGSSATIFLRVYFEQTYLRLHGNDSFAFGSGQ
jgi:hypothetical protein